MRTARMFANLILLFALILFIGCNADNERTNYESDKTENGEQTEKNVVSYVRLAKKVVRDYDLTQIPFQCLKFEDLEGKHEFKAIVDVRELHNEMCRGDRQTSPRLFSIAFDKNNNVWTDAKSLLGQLEPLD